MDNFLPITFNLSKIYNIPVPKSKIGVISHGQKFPHSPHPF